MALFAMGREQTPHYYGRQTRTKCKKKKNITMKRKPKNDRLSKKRRTAVQWKGKEDPLSLKRIDYEDP